MEDTIISARVEKKLYKKVIKFCKVNGIKVKIFIADALHTELELKGANYGEKSVK